MNNEEKYEKALSVAKKWHTDGVDDVKRVIECIFPELAESEDEKMIRIIIKLLQDINKKNKSMIGDILLENCIAWLEKQKPAEWSKEDEKMLQFAIDDFQFCVDNKQFPYVYHTETQENVLNWLKSLKPQPHWNPSKEQMQALKYEIESTNENSWQRRECEKLYVELQKL